MTSQSRIVGVKHQNTKRSRGGISNHKVKLPPLILYLKTYKHLWEQFISKENFELAYKHAIKGKSKQRQIRQFKKNKDENLEKVRQLVISGNFHTSQYKKKTIYGPKERDIYKRFKKISNISNYDKDKLKQQIASTNGWLKHSNSYNLRQSLDLNNLLAS